MLLKCSQNVAFARFARKLNLDELSLARARKIFAIARMLGFSLLEISYIVLCRFLGAEINVLSNAIKYAIQSEDLQKEIVHRASSGVLCGIERMRHKF